MNTVIITGKVVGSVKSARFSDSSCFSKFTIQINESKKSKAFVTVAVWGAHAEYARDHLTEGTYINVYGKLSPRTETIDGVVHNYYEVIALSISLVTTILTSNDERIIVTNASKAFIT